MQVPTFFEAFWICVTILSFPQGLFSWLSINSDLPKEKLKTHERFGKQTREAQKWSGLTILALGGWRGHRKTTSGDSVTPTAPLTGGNGSTHVDFPIPTCCPDSQFCPWWSSPWRRHPGRLWSWRWAGLGRPPPSCAAWLGAGRGRRLWGVAAWPPPPAGASAPPGWRSPSSPIPRAAAEAEPRHSSWDSSGPGDRAVTPRDNFLTAFSSPACSKNFNWLWGMNKTSRNTNETQQGNREKQSWEWGEPKMCIMASHNLVRSFLAAKARCQVVWCQLFKNKWEGRPWWSSG